MTLELVKNLYDAFPFFKDMMSTKVRITNASVDVFAQDIGEYIIPMINPITRRGGTFPRNCSMDFRFCNPMKSKHPDAISQNLVGIKKYAAGWFIGYK